MQSSKNNRLFFAALWGALLLMPVFMFQFDPEVMRWTSDSHNGRFAFRIIESVRLTINFAANGATLITLAFVVYLVGKYRKPEIYEAGRSLLIGLVSAGVTVQILKHLIGRARPRLTYELVFIGPSLKSGYDSLPSGHTTMAFCFAYIASQYYPGYRAALYVYAVAAALCRVDSLSHFPSDVIAGAVVGTLIAKFVLAKLIHKGEAAA